MSCSKIVSTRRSTVQSLPLFSKASLRPDILCLSRKPLTFLINYFYFFSILGKGTQINRRRPVDTTHSRSERADKRFLRPTVYNSRRDGVDAEPTSFPNSSRRAGKVSTARFRELLQLAVGQRTRNDFRRGERRGNEFPVDDVTNWSDDGSSDVAVDGFGDVGPFGCELCRRRWRRPAAS